MKSHPTGKPLLKWGLIWNMEGEILGHEMKDYSHIFRGFVAIRFALLLRDII